MFSRFSLPPQRSAEVQSHLSTCDDCARKADGSSAQSAPRGSDARGVTADRRSDVRAPLDAPIWLRVLDLSAPLLEGRIVNVSKKGFKLKLPKALQPGMGVQARLGGRIIMAEVRYCLPEGEEYHVGIEIQDVFPIPGKSFDE
jgi:PilZ domain